MFKLDVKKNGKIVHQVGGSSQEDCLAQLQPYFEHKTFGNPEKTEHVLVSEAIPEVLDEEGNVIQEAVEAVYETVITPAEYEIEIEDITQEIEAEKTKQEQKRLTKEARKAGRKAIDVAKITNVKALLPIVENLIKTVEELEERLG